MINNTDGKEGKTKSLKKLVEEGLIPKEKWKSMLFLFQTGINCSSTPEDAEYIAEQIKKLNSGEEIGV
mgnify:CR=1 FL=1